MQPECIGLLISKEPAYLGGGNAATRTYEIHFFPRAAEYSLTVLYAHRFHDSASRVRAYLIFRASCSRAEALSLQVCCTVRYSTRMDTPFVSSPSRVAHSFIPPGALLTCCRPREGWADRCVRREHGDRGLRRRQVLPASVHVDHRAHMRVHLSAAPEAVGTPSR